MAQPGPLEGGPVGHGPARPLEPGETTSIGSDPPGAAGDALPGSATTVGRDAGGSGERSASASSPASSPLLDLTALVGATVHGPADATLGHVSAVLADPHSGRLAYLVLTPLPGLIDGPRAIPWLVVVAHLADGALHLPYTADTLGMAPALVNGRVPDDDGDWVQRLHEFFGCRPYWVA